MTPEIAQFYRDNGTAIEATRPALHNPHGTAELHPDDMLPEAIRLIRIEASRDYPNETINALRYIAAVLESIIVLEARASAGW